MRLPKSRRRDFGCTIYFGATVTWVFFLVAFGALYSSMTMTATSVLLDRYEEMFYRSQGQFITGRSLLQSDTASNSIVEFKEEIPRYNLRGQKVGNTFAPSDINYYESLIVMAIPGFVLGILSCVTGCCFFVLRSCCNLCGGKGPKEGGYSLKERYIPKQLLLAVGLMTIVACIFGWVGNANFSKGITKFFDIIIETIDRVINTTVSIESKLAQLTNSNTTAIEESVRTVRDAGESFKSTAENAKATTKQYDGPRSAIINIGYVVAAVTAVCGVVGSLLNMGKICLIMAVTGFVSLTFLWISFGIHLPVSIVLADFCVAIDNFVKTNSNGNGTNALDPQTVGLQDVLKCLTDNTYAPVFDLTYKGADDSLKSVNNYTVSCCGIAYTVDNITALNVSLFPQSYQSQIQSELNNYLIYLAIQKDLFLLANCSFVRNAYNDMTDTLCVTMLKSIDYIMGTQGLIGTIFIPGVYLAIVGMKRFPHPKSKSRHTDESQQGPYAEKEEYEDEEYYEEDNRGHHNSNSHNKEY